MKKVIVLGGGRSTEREISLSTSKTIRSALSNQGLACQIIDPADYTDWYELTRELKQQAPDMVFLGLHGAAGEDGRVQGLLSLCDIPYTGCDSHASNLCMNKLAALCVAEAAGIKTAPRIVLGQGDTPDEEMIVRKLGLPLVVKPNESGSSVGISIVHHQQDLRKAIDSAAAYDRLVLCEKYIKGRELTVTILDDKALPVVEIVPKSGWYDFVNKYTKGNTTYICPAELDEQEKQSIKDKAKTVFNILGCSVYSRIDFRYDGKEFYFLEVNTLPGMTGLSLTPMAAKAEGYTLGELLMRIIELSQKRYKGKK